MASLTIHTATYNRGYILGKAYESLKNQTCKDFEWIITDDGSTDETDTLISSWLKEDLEFPIIYNKLAHVGLPRALNYGVSITNSSWFMRLDSDDYLVHDAVEKILVWLAEVEKDTDFCGIAFAKSYPDGKYMKDQEPLIDPKVGYVDATHLERGNYNLDMDMCEVHRTSIMKKYPSHCWPGEMFAPEQLNYYEIAMAGYKLRWRAEKLYVCDYLQDGLTKDDRIVKNNPMGYAMMYNQNMLFQKGFRTNFRNAMQMIGLIGYAGHFSYLKESNNKWMTALAFPAGLILTIRRKRQYAKLP